MSIQLLLLVAGLVLLVAGGDLLVRGASGLARALGVPPLVIGLSIVAFGTSAPELAVNVLAALSGNGAVSFGNVFGSNIANVGLVLGSAALVRQIGVKAPLVRREIPMMLLATAVALLLALDRWLVHREPSFDRADGAILLVLFGVFVFYTVRDVIERRIGDRFLHDVTDVAKSGSSKPAVISSVLALIGFALLAGGGRVTVLAAVEVARTLHMPEEVIGLSVIAIGTSLPELVASLMAAMRGETDLAVGNVVGSNIFNLLFVLGVTSVIAPVPVPAGGVWDLAAVSLMSLILLTMAISDKRKIVRGEGAMLLLLYVGYVALRLAL